MVEHAVFFAVKKHTKDYKDKKQSNVIRRHRKRVSSTVRSQLIMLMRMQGRLRNVKSIKRSAQTHRESQVIVKAILCREHVS